MVEQLREEEFLEISLSKGWPFLVSPALLSNTLSSNGVRVTVLWTHHEANVVCHGMYNCSRFSYHLLHNRFSIVSIYLFRMTHRVLSNTKLTISLTMWAIFMSWSVAIQTSYVVNSSNLLGVPSVSVFPNSLFRYFSDQWLVIPIPMQADGKPTCLVAILRIFKTSTIIFTTPSWRSWSKTWISFNDIGQGCLTSFDAKLGMRSDVDEILT